MKVLIVGNTGQLGRALEASVPEGIEAIGMSRPHFDLTNEAIVEQCVGGSRADVVINAAAYTHVDRAEQEESLAFAVNAAGSAHLARAVARVGGRLINVSTDYVFDGGQGKPYRELDRPAPVNVYGRSKLEGERHLQAILGERALTVRTSWLYSARGRNFLNTMLGLMRQRGVVHVVNDQIGCPTSARSLAQCLWRSCASQQPSGILHWTDAGVASWYDFAVAIGEEAHGVGLLPAPVSVIPIPSSRYPTAAVRPSYSLLDCQRTQEILGLEPVHWRIRLREALRELCDG